MVDAVVKHTALLGWCMQTVALTHLPLFWFSALWLLNVFIALAEISNLLAFSVLFTSP
jgi:hypothetical protein